MQTILGMQGFLSVSILVRNLQHTCFVIHISVASYYFKGWAWFFFYLFFVHMIFYNAYIMVLVVLKKNYCIQEWIDQVALLASISASVRESRWLVIPMKGQWHLFILMGQPSLAAFRWGLFWIELLAHFFQAIHRCVWERSGQKDGFLLNSAWGFSYGFWKLFWYCCNGMMQWVPDSNGEGSTEV